MKRNFISALSIVLAFIAMTATGWAANDRLYTATILPNNVPSGNGTDATLFNLVVTNNILSGPSHFLRQIVVTVPAGFTIQGTVTVQAPILAPLPWKATVNGNTITVVSGSSSDASVTAGQSVIITVPAIPPSIGCSGGSYVWGINASQVVGGGGIGNAYLPTPNSPAPTVSVTCDTQTNLTLSVSPDAIITTDAAAMVTFTSKLTKKSDGTPLNHELITFSVGGLGVPCIGAPIYTDVSGNATCSYYPQAAPNTPLVAGDYDCLAAFAGDSSVTPHLGSSGAGPEKLSVNATATGLDVSAMAVPYSTNPQAVTPTATLTSNGLPVVGKTVSFSLGGVAAGTGITNGSGVATSNATLPVLLPGTYGQYVEASFVADNTYSGATGSAALTVGSVAATISFDAASLTQTYTGDPLSPTVTTNPPNLNYTVIGFPQTDAGDYTVSATINDPIYSGTTGNQTFKILQANATIIPHPYNLAWDSNAHAVTAPTATGVKGENLGGGLSGDAVTASHTNVGTYGDTWTFNGGTNYVSTNGTVDNVITKANQSITFTSMIVTATASSGLDVSFITTTPLICSVLSGNPAPGKALVTLLSGTWAQCSVRADQSGSANYNSAQATAVLAVQ